MGFWEKLGFGGKKTAAKEPSITHLAIEDMQPGYFVDYDLKSWEVVARHRYNWGNDDISHEWQLKSHDETIYLEREEDDEVSWSVSRPLPFSRLGDHVRNHILRHDDPPEEIPFENQTFYLESSGAGYFLKNGQEPGQPFVAWDFATDDGRRYLCIEQWGETEFEASIGEPVKEYQFTNILPGGKQG